MKNPDLLHAMIDIETFSTKDNAAIMWIGAVKFRLDTPLPNLTILENVVDCFDEKITLQSNLQAGRDIDPRTIRWWIEANSEMCLDLMSFKQESGDLRKVLNRLRVWLLEPEPVTYVWSNGMNFDLKILANAYLANKQNIPWKYKHERDTRTLWHIAGRREQPEQIIKHHPVHDAWTQAQATQTAWRNLTNGY